MSIAETILTLAAERGPGKTICPSEVARRLWPHNWRPHMQEVRTVAYQLRDKGQVRILQKGIDVKGNDTVGPIRIAIT